MGNLTFQQVIANIKEGEVYEVVGSGYRLQTIRRYRTGAIAFSGEFKDGVSVFDKQLYRLREVKE